MFYRLLHESPFAFTVDEPVPAEPVAKYVDVGLRQKTDAFIGTFVDLPRSVETDHSGPS